MVIRRFMILLVSLGVGWWLFADTYALYAPSFEQASGISGTTEIRFAHFGTYQDYELWRRVIDAFHRFHPDVRVRQEYVVGLAGQYNTKMRQQMLTHTLPDVALVQLGPFHQLAGHFADLSGLLNDATDGDERLSAALDATGLTAFRFSGTQRGLPISGGNLLIYGNTECFERASRFHGRAIPLPVDDWTIDDFHTTAKLLTCDFDGDGRYDQFGFWLPRWIYYLPFLWSFGADLTDDALTQWRLVGVEAEQAFTFYRNLAVGARVCPREDEVPQLFQDVGFLTGKVALCVNGPWFMPFLAQTPLADSYFVAPIPRGPGGRVTRITWDGMIMAKDLPSRRRAGARRFITFLLSRSVQDRIARTGRALPARRESVVAFVESPRDIRRELFIDALSYSRLQPLLPHFGEIDRVINLHLTRWLNPACDLSAAVILDRLARDPVIVAAFPGSESRSP